MEYINIFLVVWTIISIIVATGLSILLLKAQEPQKHKRIIGPVVEKLKLRSGDYGGVNFLGYCTVYYLDDEGEIKRRVIVKHPGAVLSDNTQDMTNKIPKKAKDFYN